MRMSTDELANADRPAPESALRMVEYGAIGTLVGILVSGPLALAVVEATRPQPAWQSAELFARSYHPIQTLPFAGGFVLVGSLIALMAGIHAMARREQRPTTTVALVLVAAFASLVLFNYVLQTTFVPELARHYVPENGPILSAFSMANPTSLAWGLEMWGYAFLGAATWLVAPLFRGGALERATCWAFVANGPVSIGPAVMTAVAPGWEMTGPGLVGFGVWNLLLFVMAALALAVARRRGTEKLAAAPT